MSEQRKPELGHSHSHAGVSSNGNAPSEHGRRVFSVDDDPDEVQKDIRYLEGLQDGLRIALKDKKSLLHLQPTRSAPPVNQDGQRQHSSSVSQRQTPSPADPQGPLGPPGSIVETLDSQKTVRQKDAGNANSKRPCRPKLNVHRSLSKLAGLTTPDSGLGFDFANSGAKNGGAHAGGSSLDHYVLHQSLDSPDQDVTIEELVSPHDSDLEDAGDRVSSASSLESYTLRERQDAINKTHPFGIRIWKPALYKKMRSVQRAAAEDIHETNFKQIDWSVHLTNWIWSLTSGLFLCSLFTIAGILVCTLGLFTKSARDYSMVFFKLARYLLSPFGKVVYMNPDENYLQEDRDEGISVQQFYKWVTSYSNKLFFHQSQTIASHSNNPHPSYGSIQNFMTSQRPSLGDNERLTEEQREALNTSQRRYFGRGKWTIGRIYFYVLFHLILEPVILVLSLLLWLVVFTIPMSNILWNLLYHLRKHPLALGFKNISNTNRNDTAVRIDESKNILLCTFRCAGWHYYKFTVDGTNVIVVNLISLVFFTICDFYLVKKYLGCSSWLSNESTIFTLCLISIIPLAFYIGQAVASISAQTSMGVGAVINAFFSTIVEVYLYCVALNQRKGLLVEGSMIGSVLGAVLLLPGLSMCGGALNRKTQRYNPASAGVSSALLIFSMIVMFVPTILYEIYGGYTVKCRDEENALGLSVSSVAKAITYEHCYFTRPALKHNKLFTHIIQPMSVSCAVVLFLAYAIGLWFTLRTHAKMIWELPIGDASKDANDNQQEGNQQPAGEEENNGGHDAPNWSRSKSTWILLVATLLYAIIAEILVACVDSVLEDFPSLNPKFLGLTIFALVPNTTEFLNAISFAIHGNVALSMEIGSAYALQVCLLQIPALVLYSIMYTWNKEPSSISIREQMFPMVFPTWDLIGTMASIFMFTYLYAEGKSNYFKGSVLILMYIIIIFGFYSQGVIKDII
ncbi:calcium/hydrogen antiporter KNAG_0K02540 [Huiozyma naganishii CBS 8797]|uniref:Sodium/calcium exchanger membrane region domain-containing protein n=1 Tax=Huiozyma naganishii (strain ATCC MYA-139 / BCRC 22969 / CBS 8797 / KCTC 17520 / NBRC 10181 / NCYC 3082 / Yp74L-3) TaxID=1071383 RepID=J7S3G9_HUIN7|nr:hypothetical protein KNAG_0K02540 [Kazachstania naganishii CBS 8797]CCK72617.1 hypothetical protein KNAG_0K02540 [Kazachstania naganishii CBS 8797]